MESVDMSLDDIIAQKLSSGKRREPRRRGGEAGDGFDDRAKGGKGWDKGGGYKGRRQGWGGKGRWDDDWGEAAGFHPYAPRAAPPSADDERWGHDRYEQEYGGGPKLRRRLDPPSALPHFWTSTVRKVHISGLPWDWDEEDLRGVMDTVGDVEKITIFYDDSGRPIGSGMVTFTTAEGARAAVEQLDGAHLGRAEVTVSFSRNQADREPRPRQRTFADSPPRARSFQRIGKGKGKGPAGRPSDSEGKRGGMRTFAGSGKGEAVTKQSLDAELEKFLTPA
eukprot:TRINITY_DN7657_c0_g1_i2.p1 TRINITY_DN7657_c0_g1~~TRINITY_DN7657_c0_g1_i2.p1  ORF type:complete len:314 (+),score=80.42 TRINITY_DN7657_c0_g1_i2:106-942(+)